jgi:glutamate--cysteine ligase
MKPRGHGGHLIVSRDDMTDRIAAARKPIESVDELVARFTAGAKSRAEFKIGAEHEKVGVWVESGAPVPFHGPRGIAALFAALVARGGWIPVVEAGEIIALHRDGTKITLEPGGQLELSGDPLATVDEVARELQDHLAELAAPSAELGIAWLGLGFRPWGGLDDIEWVPKGRYAVMRAELPRRGRRGLDMMKRTATVQANVDYADEDDAERKLRAALNVTSAVTALFASSPLVDGLDAGFQSYRAWAWLDTDDARCGLLPFAWERGGLFRRYTEWALDVPLLFRYRAGAYQPANGVTFRRFMREGIDGERATLEDWDMHLTTLFPEARLKHYLELRGADAGPLPMVLALPALWKGLLYDDDACAAATALTAGLGFAERQALRAEVPRAGLAARLPDGRTMHAVARELVDIAAAGLARVAPGEERYLAPLEEVAATGRTVADRIRELAATGDRQRVIAALRL